MNKYPVLTASTLLALAACHAKPTAPNLPEKPKALASAGASPDRPVMTSVTLGRDKGTFTVPVTINDAIKLNFTIDSGASDVQIPADVVMTMVRSGTLDRSDFIGQRVYQLADGSELPSYVFRIRSLQVGNVVIRNVSGAVAGQNGSLLLGQSFLSRLSSWSVNNQTGTLVLGAAIAGGDAVPMSPTPQIAVGDKTDSASHPADTGDRLKDLMLSYLEIGGQNDLPMMRKLYGAHVIYYGQSRTIDEIIAEKQRYIERWPDRTYSLRDQSFSERCADTNNCRVDGIVDWTAASSARGRRASGAAQVELGYLNGQIILENSKVIARN